ncbi:hypothetical protein DPMN_048737 [Dreissena polymorpha]|uniref:Uncharacterized protein n=1 Tax=Dreissena polymorpha TaxID=45954 RepID=A0A9D4DB87_DREPO|nr:hypothetical protein DPMN_048737 [Dreissena polymorpha]
MLMKNNIPAQDIRPDTNQQAKIQGVNITVDRYALTIYNLYCPKDKDSACSTSKTFPPRTACLLETSTATQPVGSKKRQTEEENK